MEAQAIKQAKQELDEDEDTSKSKGKGKKSPTKGKRKREGKVKSEVLEIKFHYISGESRMSVLRFYCDVSI